jgi:hypothetical protein
MVQYYFGGLFPVFLLQKVFFRESDFAAFGFMKLYGNLFMVPCVGLILGANSIS